VPGLPLTAQLGPTLAKVTSARYCCSLKRGCMAEQSKAGHKAFAFIVVILAAVLIGRGIYILIEGSYTLKPRYGQSFDITGPKAYLFALSSIVQGAAFMGLLPYLLRGRGRLTLFIGGGFGLLYVLLLVGLLFVEG
jgi:hypothetical protein